jgi:hypothetical protein
MRPVAAAAAAVLALGVAAVLAVVLFTEDRGGTSPAAAGSEGAAAGEPAAAAGPAPGRFDPFAPGGLQAPPDPAAPPERFAPGSAPDLAVEGTRLPPVPPKEPWISVPLRPRDLRTLWVEISSRLPDLPACWAEEPRSALHPDGGGKKSSPPVGAPAELILEIESSAGRLRVAETTVESAGDDRRATIECARGRLKGLSFDIPGSLEGTAIATPGSRARMRFVLQ